MRNKLIVLLSSFLLLSCGKEKSESTNEVAAETKSSDKFSVVFEGVYKNDDSLSVVYKKNGYWDYDHPIACAVKGQDTVQKFTVDIPEGDFMENFQVTLSTNKAQKEIKLNSIEVLRNGAGFFDGKALTYVPFFNANEGLKWNAVNMSYELSFDGKYPPGLSGNEKFEEALQKGGK